MQQLKDKLQVGYTCYMTFLNKGKVQKDWHKRSNIKCWDRYRTTFPQTAYA